MKKEDEGKERKRNRRGGIIYLFIKKDEKEIDLCRALKSLFGNYFLNYF